MKALLKFSIIMCLVIPATICETEFDRNRTVVTFDPRVSLYDNLIGDNMTDSQILPLIEKVSTKFSKIYLESWPKHRAMTEAVLRATTNFNKLKSNNSSSSAIKIWIRFGHMNEHSYLTTDGMFQEIMQLLAISSIANHSGPVEVIVFPLIFLTQLEFFSAIENVRALFTKESENGYFKFGVEFNDNECQRFSNWIPTSNVNFSSIVDIVLVRGLGDHNYYQHGVHRAIQKLKESFTRCLEDFQLQNTVKEIGFITHWPDTPKKFFQNSSNLVNFWKSFNDWAIRENYFVVFERAFDRPVFERDFVTAKNTMLTNGWFRLVESSDYKDPSEYVFQSKEESALAELRFRNLTWLQGCTKFSRKLLVPALNPVMITPTEFGCVGDNNSPLDRLVGFVAQEFSSVYVHIPSHNDYLNYRSVRFLKAVQRFNKKVEIVQQIRLVIEINPDQLPISMQPLDLNDCGVMLNETDLVESIETLILNVDGVEGPNQGLREYINIMKSVSESPQFNWINEKLAMSIDIDECFKDYFAQKLTILLEYTSTFYVYDHISSAYCGEERYLNLIIFEFENCEKQIIKIVQGNKNISFLFGVKSPHPPSLTTSLSYYNGRMAAGSVHLWHGFNKWALQRNSTIIMHNAFAETGYCLWKLYHPEDKSFKFSYWVKDSRTEAIKWAQTFYADEVNDELVPWQIFAATAAAFVVGVFLAASLWLCHRRFKNKDLTELKGIDEIFQGNANEADSFYRVPYNKEKYEVSLEDIVLDLSEPLGKGEFGEVFKSTVQLQTTSSSTENKQILVCAVKINKSGTSESARQALRGSISELKILQYLGEHENIILLIGAHTSDIPNGKSYIILELCELGSLRDYLRLRLSNEVANTSQNCYDQQDMIRWSQEIVNGMEYLASKKVVHADLATRNVLLTATKQCKITDFGLSRRLQNYKMYQKKSNDPLPWRWMAPESLRFLQFTEKSDVWSFGVTLWEIFSYGALPFPFHNWDAHFEQRLNEGLRLSQPACDEKNMYEIMNNCWKLKVDDRPEFFDLKRMLTHGINQAVLYVDVAESSQKNEQ